MKRPATVAASRRNPIMLLGGRGRLGLLLNRLSLEGHQRLRATNFNRKAAAVACIAQSARQGDKGDLELLIRLAVGAATPGDWKDIEVIGEVLEAEAVWEEEMNQTSGGPPESSDPDDSRIDVGEQL